MADYQLDFYSKFRGENRTSNLVITDYRRVMRELQKLDKDYVAQLRRNFREIAKPVQTEIKREIPNKLNPPISGMQQVHFGRVAWGTNHQAEGYPRPKPAKSALIQTPTVRKNSKYNKQSIVRVVVGAPGTVLADMAGSSNKYTGRYEITRLYDYMYTTPDGRKVPGKRRHRINGQGQAFINALNSALGRPSRFVWKAAKRELPAAQKAMRMELRKVNVRMNRYFRK